MSDILPEKSSFRDPSGQVFYHHDEVYRTVNTVAAERFEFVRQTGLIEKLMDRNILVGTEIVEDGLRSKIVPNSSYLLKHERIPFISYPYEWPFALLKKAALCQLDAHLIALEHNVTLVDASAYNVQFRGVNPVFIDALSFVPYQEGEFWSGHRQFCEQFLFPLLLNSILGVAPNNWFRGELNGIPSGEFRKLLPARSMLSLNIWLHVILPEFLGRRVREDTIIEDIKSGSFKKLPKIKLQNILKSLVHWVSGLQPKAQKTTWSDYSDNNSYELSADKRKIEIIEKVIMSNRPSSVWDIGCNTGRFSEVAISAGSESVVGFDFDFGALNKACLRAEKNELNFLPLYLNAANPSPRQGWLECERMSLTDRSGANFVLALALVHHLAIGANIPLSQTIKWLLGLAPRGIVEFVPKSDPMVKKMLLLREDIFADYNFENFMELAASHSSSLEPYSLPDSDRVLIYYRRD